MTRRHALSLGTAMLIALAPAAFALPAEAESVLQYIPTLKPPAGAAKLPLQNRFRGLDRQYQALTPAARLRLAPQRNAIKQSVDSIGPASALDAIELDSKMDRLSQRLSATHRLPARPIVPVPTVK
jgi:hypothetical protein